MTHLMLRKTVMDNPFFAREHAESRTNPAQITVVRNIKESAVATLAARGHLNGAQVKAAEKVRGLWERAAIGPSRAIDYTRQPVDGGGGINFPITDRNIDAARTLRRLRVLLGLRPYQLVISICAEGRRLEDIANTKRGRLTAADNLRDALSDLADHFALKTKR